MGIPHKILVAIQQMCAKNETQVKIGKRTSIGYKTTEGLKHRCGLSQSLFKIYLESVLYDWNKKCKRMGLPVRNKTIQHVLFVDDQVIMARDKDDTMQNIWGEEEKKKKRRRKRRRKGEE
jgi:hypothetical protein